VRCISVSLRDWVLGWVKGSIVSYFSGETPLEVVIGVVRRAIKSYGVKTRRNQRHHRPQGTRLRTKHIEKNERRELGLY
jgi:hypothetical protein